MTWLIIVAIVWHIAGAVLLLWKVWHDFMQITLFDVILALIGGSVGILVVVGLYSADIVIIRKKL